MDENGPPLKRSLLPYEEWAADALRAVAVRALAYAETNGLPGGHHFYLTFRTEAAGVVMPPQLRAQFPHEMTIVLQHQFWDLAVDEAAGRFSVGLSFGGVPTKLTVPFAALISFVDPEVQLGLRFVPPEPDAAAEPTSAASASPGAAAMPPHLADEPAADKPQVDEPAGTSPADQPPADKPQVVSLDAFRRRSNKE